ncbi:MAG: hypothetical protein ABSE73_31240 [Planctomycetota bacterium]
MALEKELQTYRRELEHLLEHEGMFVLIKEDQVIDFYDTYGDAIKSGYEKFKFEPFFVKQVQAVEPIIYFNREITCPT